MVDMDNRSAEILRELQRQHRRLKGLISELEKVAESDQDVMTILDLDEIQAAIKHCLTNQLE
jgi:hypothetical protein